MTQQPSKPVCVWEVVDRRGGSSALRRCHRYRLYPTRKQEADLLRQLELCRRLYNKALWKRQGIYERIGVSVGYAEQCRWLPGLKNDIPEYKKTSPGILEDVLRRVDLAYGAFFRRIRTKEKSGYPRSKGPGSYKSMTVTRAREFKLGWDGNKRFGRLSFRGFSGLRVRMHRPLPEGTAVRRVMIKREASGHWYAIFGCDIECRTPNHPAPEEAVGLHPGLVAYLSTDRGEIYEPHHAFGRHRRKLAKRQRRLSRKKRVLVGEKSREPWSLVSTRR